LDTADIQHIIGKLGHLSFDLTYSSDIFSINLVTLIVENTSQCDVTLLCLFVRVDILIHGFDTLKLLILFLYLQKLQKLVLND
jgi:hypothetical protein